MQSDVTWKQGRVHDVGHCRQAGGGHDCTGRCKTLRRGRDSPLRVEPPLRGVGFGDPLRRQNLATGRQGCEKLLLQRAAAVAEGGVRGRGTALCAELQEGVDGMALNR